MLEICDYEILNPFWGTPGTMKELQKEYPDAELFFLAGADKMRLIRIMAQRYSFLDHYSSAFYPNPMRTLVAFWILKMAAKQYFPDASLYLGCEVKCEADRMDRVLKALRKGTFPTMNGTPYVLTEFSQWVMPENTIPCIQKLTKAGWKPIIAHMERYEYLRNMPDLVDQFREMGCLIQVNAYSLVEEIDEDIKNWARSLAGEQKIDFLGTDMHRTYHRPPSVETDLKWLYENYDKDYADDVSFGNAQKLLLKQ